MNKGTKESATMEVTAHVTREEGLGGKWWWVAQIDPGGGATQARRLDQLIAAVREAVIVRDDLDEDAAVRVQLDYSAVPGLDEELTAIHSAEEEEAAARATAAEHIRRLVGRSLSEGWTSRDLAAALGISYQYAARLRHDRSQIAS